MVDFNELLRQIKQDGLSKKSFDRIKHAIDEGGISQLGDQLRDMFAGNPGSQAAAGGQPGGPTGGGPSQGGSTDFFGEGAQDALDKAKDLLAKRDKRMIGGIGAALGVLLGGGLIKGGLGGALMAILGTAAYDSLNKDKTVKDELSKGHQSDLPVGVRPPETVEEAETLETRAVLSLKAMIAAAKADGHIDQRERERILDKMKDAGADDEIREFVAREAASPLDIDALVREVPDQQTAAQVYAASLLAIDVDSPAEKAYLRELATKLGLDDQVVANLHDVLGAPTVA